MTSIGLVFEPMADALEAVFGEVGEGTLVMIDVNVRAPVIRDPAAYRARLGRVLARCHVVKAVREATCFASLVAARTVERAGASPPRLAELPTA